MLARVGNVGLGLWMVLSAFVWSHMRVPFVNSLLTGALLIVTGLTLSGSTIGRMMNGLIGVWLLASILVVAPAQEATVLNAFIVGMGSLGLAFIPRKLTDSPGATSRTAPTHPAIT